MTQAPSEVPTPVLDTPAFDALLRDNFDFIWRLVRRLGVPAGSVEDTTQEVFLVAMRRQADIQPGSGRSFLYGIALRVAADARRRAGRRREVSDGNLLEQEATGPDAEEVLEQRQARALLDEILDAMDPDLRAVFVLYELEGLTAAEIATCTGLPMGTVASRLRRAREDFQARAKRLKLKRGIT